jgi:hypothetical protein
VDLGIADRSTTHETGTVRMNSGGETRISCGGLGRAGAVLRVTGGYSTHARARGGRRHPTPQDTFEIWGVELHISS